jgi:hypothetical protein
VVVNYTDGRFAVQFNGMPLSFRVFDKIRTVDPGTIVENKRLGAALALVKQHQAAYAPHQRRKDIARWRGLRWWRRWRWRQWHRHRRQWRRRPYCHYLRSEHRQCE